MSGTGPYQSRLFSFFSRQSHRLAEHYGQTLRRAKLTVVWGTQILLYPVYAVFQTTRLLGRQVQQTVNKVPGLKTAPPHPNQEGDRHDAALTADTPIQATLALVRSLPLQLQLSTARQAAEATESLAAGTSPEATEPTVASAAALPLTGTQPPLSLPASPEIVLSSTQPLAPPSSPKSGLTAHNQISATGGIQTQSGTEAKTLTVRGIATHLNSRKLVLVDACNQLLDVLTPHQHTQIQEQMVWEIAHYWRRQKALQLAQKRQPATLPLPGDRPHLLPPVRLFRRLMAWMQTGPVAIATNLFQETAALPAPVGEMPSAPFPAASSPTAAFPAPKPTSERAIAQLWHRFTNRLSLPTGSPLPTLLPPSEPVDDTPWLTREDLWNSDVPPANSATLSWDGWGELDLEAGEQTPSPLLLPGASLPQSATGLGSILARIQQTLAGKQSQKLAVRPPASSSELTTQSEPTSSEDRLATEAAIAASNVALSPAAANNVALSPESASANSLRVDPESSSWIEIEATLVEYIKHPLEQLLEWLDLGMFWIEKRLAKLWQWLSQLWKAR